MIVKGLYPKSDELYPLPPALPTFSTNILSPIVNGKGVPVVNPVVGVCSLSVTLGSKYEALTIPTPLLLSIANNSTSPLLKLPPDVTIFTSVTDPPLSVASNLGLSFTVLVLLL